MRILSGALPNAIQYISTINDPQIIVDLKHVAINDGVRVRIDVESTGNSLGQVFWRGDTFCEEKSKIFRIRPGRNEYVVMIHEDDISSIRLDIGTKAGKRFTIHSIKLSNIRFSALKSSWDTFPADVDKLKQEVFKITDFHEDHIYGNITLDKDGMVFFGIPYDKGWRVKVNGKTVKPEKINIGFMGIPLKRGFYRIELKYVPPYLYAGIIVSIISLIFAVFFYHKKPTVMAFRSNNAE